MMESPSASTSVLTPEEVARAVKRAEAIHAQRLRSLKRARKFLRLKIKAEREKPVTNSVVPRGNSQILAHVELPGGAVLRVEGMTVQELVEFSRRLSSPLDRSEL